MSSYNDVTGDLIKSKKPSKEYGDNWDIIFKKKDTRKPYMSAQEWNEQLQRDKKKQSED